MTNDQDATITNGWHVIDGVTLSAPAFSGFGDYFIPDMTPDEWCSLVNEVFSVKANATIADLRSRLETATEQLRLTHIDWQSEMEWAEQAEARVEAADAEAAEQRDRAGALEAKVEALEAALRIISQFTTDDYHKCQAAADLSVVILNARAAILKTEEG